MKTAKKWLELNGEVCVECMLVTLMMGVMAYCIISIV
jgi:hypothetical protein